MTPGARIQTAIELLETIDNPPEGREAVPADTVVSGYLRGRRYIGSKDRRAITDLVYGVLRHRAEIDWRLEGAAPASRLRVIAALRLLRDWRGIDLGLAFDGGPYRPDPLTGEEVALAEAMSQPAGEKPLRVRANLPGWLEPLFAEGLGETAPDEARAMHREPPVDLRVNTLKATRDVALAALAADGIAAAPTPHSPLGLRLEGRTPLGATAAWRDGWVEAQDEGSQLCALMAVAGLADPAAGVDGAAGGDLSVLDYCAGAGGKTLALAAALAGPAAGSRLVAADVDSGRLNALAKRAARAGAADIETVVLAGEGGEPPAALAGETFGLVLVDAPCSGSGAWRRHPEVPWRLTPARLDAYRALQAEILDRAAGLVAPGGRLVYVTCSIFPAENQAQVDSFCARNPAFAQVDAAPLWTAATSAAASAVAGGVAAPLAVGGGLLLTPHRTGTDGFFFAALERRG